MTDTKPVLTLASRKVIRKPPPAMSSASLDYGYTSLDESVDFMEIRRATIALKANGLWSNPELVRMYVGKLMDLATVAQVLQELE